MDVVASQVKPFQSQEPLVELSPPHDLLLSLIGLISLEPLFETGIKNVADGFRINYVASLVFVVIIVTLVIVLIIVVLSSFPGLILLCLALPVIVVVVGIVGRAGVVSELVEGLDGVSDKSRGAALPSSRMKVP